MKNKKEKTWQERFRKLFMQGFCKDPNCHGCGEEMRELKRIETFIERLLLSQKKELAREVEGLTKYVSNGVMNMDYNNKEAVGFNQALDLAKKIILK